MFQLKRAKHHFSLHQNFSPACSGAGIIMFLQRNDVTSNESSMCKSFSLKEQRITSLYIKIFLQLVLELYVSSATASPRHPPPPAPSLDGPTISSCQVPRTYELHPSCTVRVLPHKYFNAFLFNIAQDGRHCFAKASVTTRLILRPYLICINH
jgi:hypothetical protein